MTGWNEVISFRSLHAKITIHGPRHIDTRKKSKSKTRFLLVILCSYPLREEKGWCIHGSFVVCYRSVWINGIFDRTWRTHQNFIEKYLCRWWFICRRTLCWLIQQDKYSTHRWQDKEVRRTRIISKSQGEKSNRCVLSRAEGRSSVEVDGWQVWCPALCCCS